MWEGNWFTAVFYRGPGGIKCLRILARGCLWVLAVLLQWILSKGGEVSIEHPPNLERRGPGGLLFLGILSNAHLDMLAGLMPRLFSTALGF